MKTIVQNFQDQKYLAEGAAWAPAREDAKIFARSYDALEFCLQHEIKGVEFILLDEEDQEIVRVSQLG